MKTILAMCILIGVSYSINLEEARQTELHNIEKILNNDYNNFIQQMDSKINGMKINMTHKLNNSVDNKSSGIRSEIVKKTGNSLNGDECWNNLVIDTNDVKVIVSNKIHECANLEYRNIQVVCQQKIFEIINLCNKFLNLSMVRNQTFINLKLFSNITVNNEYFLEQKNSFKIFTDSLIDLSENNLNSCFGIVENNLNYTLLDSLRRPGCID